MATTTERKPRAKDDRAPVDLKLVQPILEARMQRVTDKDRKVFARSPSLLAAEIADEAQRQGIVKTRQEWRGVYYPLKDEVIPKLFPKAAPTAAQAEAPAAPAAATA